MYFSGAEHVDPDDRRLLRDSRTSPGILGLSRLPHRPVLTHCWGKLTNVPPSLHSYIHLYEACFSLMACLKKFSQVTWYVSMTLKWTAKNVAAGGGRLMQSELSRLQRCSVRYSLKPNPSTCKSLTATIRRAAVKTKCLMWNISLESAE